MEASPIIVDEIVRSILQGAAGIAAGAVGRWPAGKEERYQADVRFNGDWTGKIRIELSPTLARQLASAMQRKPQDDLEELMVMDAVGELANMIAGNLRPLLEGARSLGVPVVTRGGKAGPEAVLMDRSYDCGGRSVSVELLAL